MSEANGGSTAAAPADGYAEHTVRQCPVCSRSSFEPRFLSHGSPIVGCRECGLLLRSPQPSDEAQAQIYGADYFLWAGSADAEAVAAELKQATAALYLDHIAAYGEPGGRRLLEVGCGHGDFLVEAGRRGYEVTGVELSASAVRAARAKVAGANVVCGELEGAELPSRSFDVVVMADVLEHVRDPCRVLSAAHRLLVPGGTLCIVTPSLDSWSARLLRQRWVEFKLEHLFYFNRDTLRRLLLRTEFGELAVFPGRKVLNLEYVSAHFQRFPLPVVTGVLRWTGRVMPRSLWRRRLVLSSGGIVALARALPETTAARRLPEG